MSEEGCLPPDDARSSRFHSVPWGGGGKMETRPDSAGVFRRAEQVVAGDLDLQGGVRTDRYFCWMEETEYAFLRTLGLSVSLEDHRGPFGFPRLHAELTVLGFPQLHDWLCLELRIGRLDWKSIEYRFEVRLQEGKGSDEMRFAEPLIARGRFLVACARFHADGQPTAILLPDWIYTRLESAVGS